MRRTFMDDQFDEWEAFVSGGQPGGADAARIVFSCISTQARRPRFVRHDSGDPAQAEHDLYHLGEPELLKLFGASKSID